MNKIYVPIYDNGEIYEDNCTYAENICFRNKQRFINWIEQQNVNGVYYKFNNEYKEWQLEVDEIKAMKLNIPYPYGCYKIKELTLKD